MGDLPMSDSFTVRSAIRGTYSVTFINDLHSQSGTLENGNFFIIDEKVAMLFKAELAAVIGNQRSILIASSEKNKTVAYCLEVIRELLAQNVRKNDSLIAIGGGITQDITAFISSILFRGVDWKFYPTTLLAQCDSCIGSKSSINFDQYKNLLGTFNPPSEIFIYPGFLKTLTVSEIRSGIGEMLHYFLTEGIWLAQEVADGFDRLLENRDTLPHFISNSLRIKKKIIEIDEFDTSIRHIFNYGHTFGHAIEAITNYQIPHGQAVSIGMDLANYISFSLGMITAEQFEEMHLILSRNIPPFAITIANIDEYCKALSRDKKNKGLQLGCILSRGAGRVEKVFLDMDDPFKKMLLTYSSLYLHA
jgi:3-dehydroquinate synthase